MMQEMAMNKVTSMAHKGLLLLIFIEVALIVALLIKETSIIQLYGVFPNLSGIILAGVVASLAIIFSSLSADDLEKIYKINNSDPPGELGPTAKDTNGVQKSKDKFLIFLGYAKNDTRLIIGSFLISVVILCFGQFDHSMVIAYWGEQNLEHILRALLFIDVLSFILSVSAVSDIIYSLFTLNKARYEWNFEDNA